MKELIRPFIIAAHGDYDMVDHLLTIEPSLAFIEMDWGAGDIESGINAAAHTGSRQIAELLLAKGAQKTLFSQAMLGDLNFVEMALVIQPYYMPKVHMASHLFAMQSVEVLKRSQCLNT